MMQEKRIIVNSLRKCELIQPLWKTAWRSPTKTKMSNDLTILPQSIWLRKLSNFIVETSALL